MSYAVQILRVSDGEFVDATLSPLNDKHLADFETFWKSRLQISAEEDAHWSWVNKNRIFKTEASYEKYAIECNQITQGLMMIATKGHRSYLVVPEKPQIRLRPESDLLGYRKRNRLTCVN